MTDISKEVRAKLDESFCVDRPEIVSEQKSSDGTMKWLLRLAPDERGARQEIETVYIPEEDRGTLCISSQVGCTLTCSFCHTGTQALVRNLTAGEIVGQIMLARDRIKDWPDDLAANPKPPLSGRYITNVVLMGMGEPLYNFDNVKQAMQIASDGEGMSLSKRRITLSTAGVVPEIVRAGEEIGTSLAISLHGTTDEIRNKLVPLNRKYPIAELLKACASYPLASNARRITFEYVMLKGINDTKEDARRLVRLLAGLPAKVNLIPFNPWPGSPYECSEWDVIEVFAEILNNAGYASPVRTPRGRDIMAACGQLKSDSQKMRAKDRLALEAGAQVPL
jgi:23S rRNA (adenine2503-C2)-methyltransferase